MKETIINNEKSQVNTLISICQSSINDEVIQTVNARELHSYLESKQEFANWIKDRINQYGFTEGSDFLIKLSKTPNGGRPSKEYHITIEMAKELSMVERNEKGKQARQYFIDCEKKAKNPVLALNDPEFLRGTLLVYTEKVIALESKVEEMRDDVEAFERIAKADGSVNLTSAAKHLQYPPHKFNQLLNSEGWIYKRRGQKNWLGYQDKVKQGLLTHKVNMYQLQDGTEMINEQVLVTPKGLTKLSQILSIH